MTEYDDYSNDNDNGDNNDDSNDNDAWFSLSIITASCGKRKKRMITNQDPITELTENIEVSRVSRYEMSIKSSAITKYLYGRFRDLQKLQTLHVHTAHSRISIGYHCPRSNDPFYIVSYYIKWFTTSWTYSTVKVNLPFGKLSFEITM